MPAGQDVIDAVRTAFAGLPVPSRDAMTNDHCEECVETWQSFCDASGEFLSWEAISLREGRALPLSLLAPPAWRYYLPALIIWCVRDSGKVDVLGDDLPHTLSRCSVPGFDERVRAFTLAQREAIALFLEWRQDVQRAEGWSSSDAPLRHLPNAIRLWRSE